MASFIQQDLEAAGVAPAICVLRADAAPKGSREPPGRVRRHFVSSRESRPFAVAAALRHQDTGTEPEPADVPAVRYYPNLGVAYGTVTRETAAALRKEAAVGTIKGAPPPNLIPPGR